MLPSFARQHVNAASYVVGLTTAFVQLGTVVAVLYGVPLTLQSQYSLLSPSPHFVRTSGTLHSQVA